MINRINPLIFLLAMLVFLLLMFLYTVPAESDTTEAYIEYTVRPGDTLWSIAREHHPGRHTGRVVHEMRELGAEPMLQVGETVRVPVETE